MRFSKERTTSLTGKVDFIYFDSATIDIIRNIERFRKMTPVFVIWLSYIHRLDATPEHLETLRILILSSKVCELCPVTKNTFM